MKDMNGKRIAQISRTIGKGGKLKALTILKVWEGEWKTHRTPEKKIKEIKPERMILENGDINTVSHEVVLNWQIAEVNGEYETNHSFSLIKNLK